MRYVKHKGFLAWNFEKEETWLDEMSAKGMQLVDVGFCRYTFEDNDPGVYRYRIELLKNVPTDPEQMAYIRFMEESGIRHVGTYMRYVYFRRPASEGAFDLFSDIDSRVSHYRRISTLLLIIGILNLILIPLNVFNIFNGFDSGYLFIVNAVLGAWLVYGAARIEFKISKLKRERLIRE
jgi:hypothetical protein